MNYCKNFGGAGRLGLREWACTAGICKAMADRALPRAARIAPDGGTVTSHSLREARLSRSQPTSIGCTRGLPLGRPLKQTISHVLPQLFFSALGVFHV